MRPVTLVILLVFIFILFNTGQVFWIILAALTLLAYSFAFVARSTSRGIRGAVKKTKDIYAGELGEAEKVTGKYPAKFYDSVGKAAMEKVNEAIVPAKAKSYADAANFVWKPKEKNVGVFLSDTANKILDGLGKLFSK